MQRKLLNHLIFLLPLFLVHAKSHAGDETWSTTTYNMQEREKETDGVLTVSSSGDVLSGGNLLLRATQKIIFQPGFIAEDGATMRAGIDADLDGFTDADSDGDGIPDHYELSSIGQSLGLDYQDPGDAQQIDSTYGIFHYDVYRMHLRHSGVSNGSNAAPPVTVEDVVDGFFGDSGIPSDPNIWLLGSYLTDHDSDGAMDHVYQVVEYESAGWSYPLNHTAYWYYAIGFDYALYDLGSIQATIIGDNSWQGVVWGRGKGTVLVFKC